MNFEELIYRINVNEAMKILAQKTGKYAQMCHAYTRIKKDGRYVFAYPNLKQQFDSEMFPLLQAICKDELGENPCDPQHPIRRWME